MTVLAIRRSPFNALSARDRIILRFAARRLALGDPAPHKAPGGAVWFVFDDNRFSLRMVAILGALTAHIGDVPSGYTLPMQANSTLDREALENAVRGLLRTRITLPEDIAYAEDDPNVWQTTLDAQGVPPAIRAANSVPDSWTPVSDEVFPV